MYYVVKQIRHKLCLNLPAIIFSVFWKRFNTTGALFGLGGGLVASLGLILVSPVGILGKEGALFPLENPGIVSIPLGFLFAIIGTFLGGHEANAEAKFDELAVRSHTGLGAEKASSH
jgi:cation/acetate symporter